MKVNAFWIQQSGARFRSHLKVRGHSKYEVLGDIFGGATLTIVFEDFDRCPEHHNFKSIEEAKLYAELAEIDLSSS